MPFTFNGNRFTEEQRKAIWSKGFPTWCMNGFDLYFGSLQKSNMLSMVRQAEWWEGVYEYTPSFGVQSWLDLNYRDFKEDMNKLAEVIFLHKNDYFSCADYLTTLYEEKGVLIRTLVSAEYMHGYLSKIFPGVSQQISEDVGVLFTESSWPNNLPANLLGKNFASDVDGFWHVLASSIDEFLGLAVRSYRGNLVFNDSPRGGRPATIVDPVC